MDNIADSSIKMGGFWRMDYKDKIIEMVMRVENEKFLKFLYEMLLSFQKKWGI